MNAAPSLSQEELRVRLFETLRRTGVADKLKSQLRARLVSELKLRSPFQQQSDASNHNHLTSSGTLLLKLIDSLFIEYLRERGYEFTLSVFMPECGLTNRSQLLSSDDALHILNLDQQNSLTRQLVSLWVWKREKGAQGVEEWEEGVEREHLGSHGTALIIRLLNALSRTTGVSTLEREMQTDVEFEDLLEVKIRQSDKDIAQRKHEQHKLSAAIMEERLSKYQRELEVRYKSEMEDQLARFKDIELAKMRIDERTRHQSEIGKLKLEYDEKCTRISDQKTTWLEEERHRLNLREKVTIAVLVNRLHHPLIQLQEMEKTTLALRQQLLEQSNRLIISEQTLKNEAELAAKEITLEKESLQRRYEDALRQISELNMFKERYTEKMNSAMAQYKIDLNREHANLLSNVEIEKNRLEAERTLLQHRKAAIDQLETETKAAQSDIHSIKMQLREARSQAAAAERARDEALSAKKELELQVYTQKSSSVFEFELQSMKKQLVEAEKMAEKRQEEYQSLLQSLLPPTETLQTELAKARKSETKWQRECQQLVVKLDRELTRNEDLQRKYEDEQLKTKELRREVADLRSALHQAQSALNTQLSLYASEEGVVRGRGRHFGEEPYLQKPFDIPNPFTAPTPHQCSTILNTHISRSGTPHAYSDAHRVVEFDEGKRRGSPDRWGGQVGTFGDAEYASGRKGSSTLPFPMLPDPSVITPPSKGWRGEEGVVKYGGLGGGVGDEESYGGEIGKGEGVRGLEDEKDHGGGGAGEVMKSPSWRVSSPSVKVGSVGVVDPLPVAGTATETAAPAIPSKPAVDITSDVPAPAVHTSSSTTTTLPPPLPTTTTTSPDRLTRDAARKAQIESDLAQMREEQEKLERLKAEEKRRQLEEQQQRLQREQQRLQEEKLRREEEERRVEIERERRREEEERERVRREEEDKDRGLREVEEDPFLRKYVELAKKRREAEGRGGGNERGGGESPSASRRSSRVSDVGFGAGDTGSGVSAPVYDDSDEDDGW
ncbi:oxidative DNA demethylase [Rhizophlyctis rosea]|nr:oxidative DNA demethylase [Rhizophlyctis rosea]